jgi:Zn finger protein HypA/HybF involved in hydrogenase expression
MKVFNHFGPDSIEVLEGAVFPWTATVRLTCPHCQKEFTKYNIGLTGDCPSCRKPLPKEMLK